MPHVHVPFFLCNMIEVGTNSLVEDESEQSQTVSFSLGDQFQVVYKRSLLFHRQWSFYITLMHLLPGCRALYRLPLFHLTFRRTPTKWDNMHSKPRLVNPYGRGVITFSGSAVAQLLASSPTWLRTTTPNDDYSLDVEVLFDDMASDDTANASSSITPYAFVSLRSRIMDYCNLQSDVDKLFYPRNRITCLVFFRKESNLL